MKKETILISALALILFATAFTFGVESATLRKKLAATEAYAKETAKQADAAINDILAARKGAEDAMRTEAEVFRGQPKEFFALPLGEYRIIHVLDTNEGLAIVSNTNTLVGPKFYFVSRIPPDKLITNSVIGIRAAP